MKLFTREDATDPFTLDGNLTTEVAPPQGAEEEAAQRNARHRSEVPGDKRPHRTKQRKLKVLKRLIAWQMVLLLCNSKVPTTVLIKDQRGPASPAIASATKNADMDSILGASLVTALICH